MLVRAFWLFSFSLGVLASSVATVAVAEPEIVADHGLLRVGSENPQIAIVLFPGGLLPSAKYIALAQAVVERSRETFSVYIANRFANLTNPIEARMRIQTVLNLMEQQGGDDARARVFVAGHSEGAIGSMNLPVSMDLGGMILLGAYVPRTIAIGQTVADYRKPVLTLGGELDGLTGINYLAREAETVQALAATDALQAAKKPVIVLRGVNHMQFADGSTLEGDLPAEIDSESARQQIADRMVRFVESQAAPEAALQERAKRRQSLDVAATWKLVKAYTATKGVEAQWCERAQVQVSGLEPQAFEQIDFETKTYRGLIGKGQFVLDKARVDLEGERFRLHLPVFVNESPGPLDVSKDHALSPDSMWCKMRTAEALSTEISLASTGDQGTGCAELNRRVIEQTLALLDPGARRRIEQLYGKISNWETASSVEAGH